jgi:hypothetical protein
MPVETDLLTDASPPELQDEHPPSGADLDTDERIDVAAGAEAADEADLVDAAEATAESGARFGWTRLLA